MLENVDEKKVDEKKEDKPAGKPQISKDNPGKVRNRPISHLNNEDFLQLRVNLLEIDKAKLEVNNIAREIEKNVQTNTILRHEMEQRKAGISTMQANHLEFVEGVKKRTGIDLRNKSIDMVTREVLSDEDAE